LVTKTSSSNGQGHRFFLQISPEAKRNKFAFCTARRRNGFSLIEILTVLLIITVLGVIGLVGFRGISKGNAVKGAVSTVSSLALAARTEAMTKGLGARLIIDATYDADHPKRYLRRFTILEASDPDGDPATNDLEWSYSTKPTLLPEGVYFACELTPPHDYSSGYDTMNFDFNDLTPQDGLGSDGVDVFFYEFNGNGRLVEQGGNLAKLIFLAGVQNPADGTWRSPDDMELSRDGFIIRRLGRLTFFDNPTQITTSKTEP